MLRLGPSSSRRAASVAVAEGGGAGLRVDDVDFDGGIVHVHVTRQAS